MKAVGQSSHEGIQHRAKKVWVIERRTAVASSICCWWCQRSEIRGEIDPHRSGVRPAHLPVAIAAGSNDENTPRLPVRWKPAIHAAGAGSFDGPPKPHSSFKPVYQVDQFAIGPDHAAGRTKRVAMA